MCMDHQATRITIRERARAMVGVDVERVGAGEFVERGRGGCEVTESTIVTSAGPNYAAIFGGSLHAAWRQ